jgi:hypothetical protein
MNLLEYNLGTIKKNTEALTIVSKEVGLEVNGENVSHHQNAGHNRDIKLANRSLEDVSQFRYFGMIVTDTKK